MRRNAHHRRHRSAAIRLSVREQGRTSGSISDRRALPPTRRSGWTLQPPAWNWGQRPGARRRRRVPPPMAVEGEVRLQKQLACVRSAPFGLPVVPEVWTGAAGRRPPRLRGSLALGLERGGRRCGGGFHGDSAALREHDCPRAPRRTSGARLRVRRADRRPPGVRAATRCGWRIGPEPRAGEQRRRRASGGLAVEGRGAGRRAPCRARRGQRRGGRPGGCRAPRRSPPRRGRRIATRPGVELPRAVGEQRPDREPVHPRAILQERGDGGTEAVRAAPEETGRHGLEALEPSTASSSPASSPFLGSTTTCLATVLDDTGVRTARAGRARRTRLLPRPARPTPPAPARCARRCSMIRSTSSGRSARVGRRRRVSNRRSATAGSRPAASVSRRTVTSASDARADPPGVVHERASTRSGWAEHKLPRRPSRRGSCRRRARGRRRPRRAPGPRRRPAARGRVPPRRSIALADPAVVEQQHVEPLREAGQGCQGQRASAEPWIRAPGHPRHAAPRRSSRRRLLGSGSRRGRRPRSRAGRLASPRHRKKQQDGTASPAEQRLRPRRTRPGSPP